MSDTGALATLEELCWPDAIAEVLQTYELRPDGLWLRKIQDDLSPQERDVLEWHPSGDRDTPALPMPFSVPQLAAFMLQGEGLLLHERLLLRAKDAFGPNGDKALRMFTAAAGLIVAAKQACDGVHAAPRQVASWLLTANPATAVFKAPPSPPPKRQIHRMMSGRVNELDAVIEQARRAVPDRDHWPSVWNELVRLADSPRHRPSPLIAFDEGKGIVYESVSNGTARELILSRNAFRLRLARQLNAG